MTEELQPLNTNTKLENAKKYVKKNGLTLLMLIISASAAFYTYQSTVIAKNIEKRKEYTEISNKIRKSSEAAEGIADANSILFEQYTNILLNAKDYKEADGKYITVAKHIGELYEEVKKIDNSFIHELRDELTKIEHSESNQGVAEQAKVFLTSFNSMTTDCFSLMNTYSQKISDTKLLTSFFNDEKDFLTRRNDVQRESYKNLYDSCRKNLKSFKEEKAKFVEMYKQVLGKI